MFGAKTPFNKSREIEDDIASNKPAAVERATNVQTFQGLGATSLLILVGVAIDTAKQVQTYVISQRYEGLVRQ